MRVGNGRYRLEQLILYIGSRLQSAEHYGSIKLNKVLYRAEISSYRELGQLLTGFHYQKNKMGPTLRAFLPVTRSLEEDGRIRWEKVSAGGDTTEDRLIPLSDPDTSVFSPGEMKIIDREIKRARPMTAGQMSNEEHKTAAWFATRTGEDIMPELSLVEDPDKVFDLTDLEKERARSSVERFLAQTAV